MKKKKSRALCQYHPQVRNTRSTQEIERLQRLLLDRNQRVTEVIAGLREIAKLNYAALGRKVWDPGTWELDESLQRQIQALQTQGEAGNTDECEHDTSVYMVDGCAGHSSMAVWALRTYPKSKVMVIDKNPKTKQRLKEAGITEEEMTRITIVYENLADVDVSRLDELTQERWNISVEQVAYIHCSFPCETYSSAQRDNNVHRQRDKSGRIKLSKTAKEHDELVKRFCTTLRALTILNPQVLVSVENPANQYTDWFMQTEGIQLLMNSKGWDRHEVHYCSNTDIDDASSIDTRFKQWTMKPTTFIVYGSHGLQFAKCSPEYPRCPYSFHPDGYRQRFHRATICVYGVPPKGQVQITDPVQRHAIPAGVFQKIFASRRVKTQSMNEAKCHFCNAVYLYEQLSPAQRMWVQLHAQLGHVGDQAMRRTVRDIPELEKAEKLEVPCIACSASKALRKPHTGRLPKATYALEIVHTDVQGPFEVPDDEGNRYSVIFVDDKTRMSWSYRIRQKSDTGQALMRFLAEVGTPPRRIRSDFGGEYLSKKANGFLYVCYERGIQPEKTVPYNPSQNGIAESMNRILLERTRTLLFAAQLPKSLWGHAYRWANRLQRLIVPRKERYSPEQKWYGTDRTLPNLRIFGSQVMYKPKVYDDKVIEVHGKKLASTGVVARYLGDVEGSDGVYLAVPTASGKADDYVVRISRDFDERTFLADTWWTQGSELAAGCTLSDYKLLASEEADASTYTAEDIQQGFAQVADTVQTPVDSTSYWRGFQDFCTRWKTNPFNVRGKPPAQVQQEVHSAWTEIRRAGVKQAASTKLKKSVEAQGIKADEQGNAVIPECLKPVSPKSPKQAKVEFDVHNKDIECAMQDCIERKGRAYHTHSNQLYICDCCNQAYHRKCYEMEQEPAQADRWFCRKCRTPGTRIELWDPLEDKWNMVTITENYGDGKVNTMSSTGEMQLYDLDRCSRWRPAHARGDTIICRLYVDESAPEPIFYVHRVHNSRDPRSYVDILKMTDNGLKQQWISSANKEWNSITKEQGVLRLMSRKEVPTNAIIVPSTWVFKEKDDGTKKSRVVLLGNQMPKDFTAQLETAAPAPRLTTVRLMLSYAAKNDLDVELVDVKTAFLHAVQSNQVYMHLPPGWRDRPEFLDDAGMPKVALLLKSLYGAADAPAAWYNCLRNWLRSQGFRHNPHDPCLHSVFKDGKQLFILHWTDDLLIIGEQSLISEFKNNIRQMFQVSEKGPLENNLYLGTTVKRHRTPRKGDGFKGFIISQPHLIQHIVERVGKHLTDDFETGGIPMLDIRLSSDMCPTTVEEKAEMAKLPYKTIVGSLGYLAIWSFPQICYSVKELGRFSANPGRMHWRSALRVVHYVVENKTWSIYISADSDTNLYGVCDANWCTQPDSYLSTTGYVIFQGTNPISNCSRTQKVVSRSTAESEYIAISSMAQELLHLRMLWRSLEPTTKLGTTSVYMNNLAEAPNTPQLKMVSDSTSAIAIAKSEWTVGKLRHVNLAWHFVRSFIRDKVISLSHGPGKELCADVHTKGFGRTEGNDPLKSIKSQKAAHFKELAMQLSGRVPFRKMCTYKD